jgi:ribonuclease E
LKTNLEAAVEISRQLRLRDLAGLIVIDFIDMEENRNNRAVERKLKDALKNDRARIQVGRISHFGLLEMSRQRLRQGMMESSTMQCPHCEGTGVIRGISSCALSVLRGIEEHLLSRKPESLDVRVHPDVAFYVFNEKRDHLLSLEENYGISIYILPDTERALADSIIERKPDRKGSTARPIASDKAVAMGDGMKANEEPSSARESDADGEISSAREEEVQPDDNGEPRKKRRRRRGRRGGRKQRDGENINGEEVTASTQVSEPSSTETAPEADGKDDAAIVATQTNGESLAEADTVGEDDKPKKRRRRSRGGRKKTEAEADATAISAAEGEQTADPVTTETPVVVKADDVTEEQPKTRKRAPRKSAKKAKASEPDDAVGTTPETTAQPAPVSTDEAKPARKPRKRAAKKAKPQETSNTEETVKSNGNSEPEKPVDTEKQADVETSPPKWTPPAPTVDPVTAPKKAGWWGKR